MKKILITGADGFIGRNLRLRLHERKDVQVVCFTHADHVEQLPSLLADIDFVFHLAGVNRPKDDAEFIAGNTELTRAVCSAVATASQKSQRTIPIVYASSAQAALSNAYGESKRAAEDVLFAHSKSEGLPVHVLRLPNVFGKWSRANYNSVVATFCHSVARGLPLRVNDSAAPVTLVHVDDVVERFVQLMDGADALHDRDGFATVTPQYSTTVGELASQIEAFGSSRSTLLTERVGSGLVRALYSTFVSYLPPESFAYQVPEHRDPRGTFVEMLKTPDCGQFSYFTALPQVTRGGHYHHTKTEKFLVVKGRARFRFRHMSTGDTHELVTSDARAEIVETVPGWSHDITNIGEEELLVMLWANEVFDRERPDTFAFPLDS